MNNFETSEKGLQTAGQGTMKPRSTRSICIKVYFKPELFKAIAEDAERAGKRRKGLLLYTTKPHGFAGEVLANTDDVPAFLKFCWQYWKENEASRLEARADVMRQEQELQERKKKLGLI